MTVSLQHIHIIAKDKYELAGWYEKYLGFKIIDDIEKLGEPGGPLFISSDGGKTALSIFDDTGKVEDTRTLCIPAFGTDAQSFVALYEKFSSETKDVLKIYDHFIFFSFYVFDPSGTKIEITCTDYEECKTVLRKGDYQVDLMNA